MGFFLDLIRTLCQILTVAIVLRAILSWVSPGQTNVLTLILFRITEPILSPLRRIIPAYGTLDFSPMVAIILLQLITYLLPHL